MAWSAPKRIRQRLGTLLATKFLERLDRGQIIDRKRTRNPKDVKTVEAPTALAKFFTPIKEAL